MQAITPKTLLIVDDEAHILKSLKRTFKRCNYTIFTASDGHEGLKYIDQETIGVILCDMRMPIMNGSEFLTQARELSPQSVRILLTGQADIDDTIKAINHGGIFKYITKPWDNNELIQDIDAAFTTYENNITATKTFEKTKEKNNLLQEDNSKLQKEIQAKHSELKKTNDSLANAYEGEKKLREAKNEAQRLNKAKSRFLATMSHEIRSPLNAIITMNTLLLESKLTSEQRELVNIAHNGGQSLLALINDILDFSKIESGKLKLSQEWFDLVETVENVSELLACQTINKPVEIQNIIDPNLKKISFGDPTRIKQILINIASNAVKFTEKGGVLIALSKVCNGIKICISDSGIGISEENKKKIFSEFTQVDYGENRNYGGTGLGLSICEQLITIMDGSIQVENNDFGGSTFTVFLPLKQKGSTLLSNTKNEKSQLICFDTKNPILFDGIKKQLSYFNCDVYPIDNLPKKTTNYNSFTHITDIVDSGKSYADYKTYFDHNLKENVPHTANKHWNHIGLISNDGVDKLYSLKLKGFSYLLRKPPRLSNLMDAMNIAHNLTHPQDNKIHSWQKEKYSNIHHSAYSQYKEKNTPLPLRILLVEDSLANQAVIKSILLKDKHTIDIANNGIEALEKTKKTPYQLILMDISMPIMDGLEATKIIRTENSINQKTTIIAMTANAFAEDREHCFKAGIDDYISKPIDVQLFKNRIYYWSNKFSPEKQKTKTENTTNKILAEEKITIDAKNKDIISHHTLKKLAKDTSWEVLPRLLNLYFIETEKRIPKIIHAYTNKDWETFSDEVHTLKSSSGTFGAHYIFELAIRFETAVDNNDTDNIQSDITSLSSIYEETEKQLTDIIKSYCSDT